jgi:hypothetical protein
LTIVTIATKTQLISASLEQLQTLLFRREDLADAAGNAPIELVSVLDATLQDCMVVFSCLEIEVIEKLGAKSDAGVISWTDKLGFALDKDHFRELLDNLATYRQ